MSTISIVEPPSPRASGRQPRLSDEAFQDLYKAVKEGHWASDNEVVPTESAAYQRAQTAVKIIGERFKFTAVKTHVAPVDRDALASTRRDARSQSEDPKEISQYIANNYTQGFQWSIGPRAVSEPPRRASSKGK